MEVGIYYGFMHVQFRCVGNDEVRMSFFFSHFSTHTHTHTHAQFYCKDTCAYASQDRQGVDRAEDASSVFSDLDCECRVLKGVATAATTALASTVGIIRGELNAGHHVLRTSLIHVGPQTWSSSATTLWNVRSRVKGEERRTAQRGEGFPGPVPRDSPAQPPRGAFGG